MLDILNLHNDINDIIFDIRINNLVLEIENFYNKIKKLEILLRPLSIDKDIYTCNNYKKWTRDDIYIISYECVYYCMFNFLYSRLNGYIIFINKYDINHGDELGIDFKSEILKNPTYFEILVEFNKSVKITGDRNYNIYLEGLEKLDKNILKKDFNIKYKKDIIYYKFITGI
tara:strand:+ start:18284 stop:18799 length:516 start_codon:yes stop_codon:yes gene_type:complete